MGFESIIYRYLGCDNITTLPLVPSIDMMASEPNTKAQTSDKIMLNSPRLASLFLFNLNERNFSGGENVT